MKKEISLETFSALASATFLTALIAMTGCGQSTTKKTDGAVDGGGAEAGRVDTSGLSVDVNPARADTNASVGGTDAVAGSSGIEAGMSAGGAGRNIGGGGGGAGNTQTDAAIMTTGDAAGDTGRDTSAVSDVPAATVVDVGVPTRDVVSTNADTGSTFHDAIGATVEANASSDSGATNVGMDAAPLFTADASIDVSDAPAWGNETGSGDARVPDAPDGQRDVPIGGSGGSIGTAGTTAVGSTTNKGGTTAVGGATGSGGTTNMGGTTAVGGTTGSPSVQISASNSSTTSVCAEQDNIDVSLTSSSTVTSYTIEATQPTYDLGVDNCAANFSQCPTSNDPSYSFTAATSTLFDDGETVVVAVREATWWQPQGMKASIDSGQQFVDAHYVTMSRNIPGTSEYPQFFVFYADGNMRLIPFPPVGAASVCFGSSVIVGPVTTGTRPYADIDSVNYFSASETLQVTYLAGGTAEFDLSQVTRTSSQVRVNADYASASMPFCAFRSMYVSDGNADVDHVTWTTPSSTIQESPILSFAGGPGLDWLFYRATRSVHNTSAPDIRIRILQ